MKLIALQIKTENNFYDNLKHFKELIQNCDENSIILAPEIALTGFCYERMEEASSFANFAIDEIKHLSKINKTIALTFITKKEEGFFN